MLAKPRKDNSRLLELEKLGFNIALGEAMVAVPVSVSEKPEYVLVDFTAVAPEYFLNYALSRVYSKGIEDGDIQAKDQILKALGVVKE